MRVSLIGGQFPDSLVDNLADALRDMGHEVQMVDQDELVWLAPLRHRFRRVFALMDRYPRLQSLRDEHLVTSILEFSPDVVLNTYATWHPDSVAKARKELGRGTKLLFLYPDPMANLGREYPLASPYDALFLKDPWGVALYRSRLGINAHYLPEACNPRWHRTVDLSSEDRARYGCDLATAGNMYYYRARMLEPLRHYDLRIWGTNYPSWLQSPLRANYPGVYVAREEKAKAFRAAKIVINSLSRNEIEGINARTFEAAGCGAFQLLDWRPAVEDLFKVDEEVVVFRSQDELQEKVAYYLAHPEERARIAEAGQRRAHADHTYQKRIEQMFEMAEIR